MANKKEYAVHEDFKHYPAFPFPFNGVVTGLLNRFLHLDTFFRQRKVKAKAARHTVSMDGGASIDIYQFKPDNAGNEPLPAMLYFHGGAFVLTYASTHVEAMDFYANQANCMVFMVDYRLAPANPFPAAFNDCYGALQWVEKNAAQLGVDPQRLVVGGDSAGGTLTAGVAQKALDDEQGPVLKGQMLIYPALDSTCSTRTAREYEKAPMFDAVANRKMWEVYLKNVSRSDVPPYAAPIGREDLSGLPQAYVENAEFDPLCDEAADYAQRLEAAGVDVELRETKGTVHGYDTVPESEITQESLQRRIAFLQKSFG